MPRKPPKTAESLRPSSASANANSISCNSPRHETSDSDMEDMPLIWEKVSDKILKHINDRFDKLDQTLQDVQRSQKELLEKVESVEEQVLDQENRLSGLEKAVSDLKKENSALKLKVDDLEGRSRRNNIKIIGIPEQEEGGKPTEFVEALIPKLLGEDNFQSSVVIDRAHRTLRPPPPEGARPRAIIARVHFYREKELILRLRRARELVYKGNKVLIFPDYTPEVMRQRREYSEALRALRELKVEHSLLFPARLRIKHKGQFKVFTTPDVAVPKQVEDGDYESSVSQEKQDAVTDSDRPISLKTDKSGRPLLETPADLQNLLLLRKTKRQQRAAARTPAAAAAAAAPPAVQPVPYYVDEDDFFKACDQKQLLLIDRYLSTGGDVNACDAFERTGLHRASSKGHTEVVSKLLEAGANVHHRDKLWSTCVHLACRGGDVSVLKLLLSHGGDITARDKLDSTPLHVSVRTGHHDCVEHLIHCGAELNAQDREGDTPLHDAVRLNRCKIIQLLLLHGADTNITNQEGRCPLDGVLEWQNETKTLLCEQNDRK
ncbi:uncharacterized protein ABDE67_020023 [Symphorus nematophorus]